MRWNRLFADLEGQLLADQQQAFAAEVADRTRREVARLHLIDRLRTAIEVEVEVTVQGAGILRGTVTQVGADWALLDLGAGVEALVPAGGVLAVRGMANHSVEPGTAGIVAGRLDRGHALRLLARDRSTVVIGLRDGSRVTGTIDRVGADFIDLAEHPPQEARRSVSVRGRQLVAIDAICVVRRA